MALTDTFCRFGVFIRGTFRHTFVYTFVHTFFSGKFIYDCFRGSFRLHTYTTVQTTPSIEADAQTVCTKTIVTALIWAQLDFTSFTCEAGLTTALSSRFVADTIVVAIIWASSLVAGRASPSLATRFTSFAIAFAGHRVACTVATAVSWAFSMATIRPKEAVVACTRTVEA